jgi:hypothetical protein
VKANGIATKRIRGTKTIALKAISSKPEAKRAEGRPTKRTPEITAEIAEAISFGLTDEKAADLVGIARDTLIEWRKIPEFSDTIKRADAARDLDRLRRIDLGAPGWQGPAWHLERKYPQRYARPEIQLQFVNKESKPDFRIWLHQEEQPKLKDSEEGGEPCEIEDIQFFSEAEGKPFYLDGRERRT